MININAFGKYKYRVNNVLCILRGAIMYHLFVSEEFQRLTNSNKTKSARVRDKSA